VFKTAQVLSCEEQRGGAAVKGTGSSTSEGVRTQAAQVRRGKRVDGVCAARLNSSRRGRTASDVRRANVSRKMSDRGATSLRIRSGGLDRACLSFCRSSGLRWSRRAICRAGRTRALS